MRFRYYKKIEDNIRDLVKNYLYNIGEYDMDKEYNMVKDELRGLGVINGDEGSTWISPDKNYVFKINRYENKLWNSNLGQYIIEIDIESSIGYRITKLRFSEIDATIILDNIANFNDYCKNSTDAYCIYINPNNTRVNTTIIELNNIFMIGNNSSNYNSRPDISFSIKQYNPLYENMVPLVTMRLTEKELRDLSFKIFFMTLIDIDIPLVEFYTENDKGISVMDHIEDYINKID